MSKTYSLAKYRDEATKQPFELDLGDGEILKLRQPSVDDVIDLNGMSDVRSQLQIIAKDDYDLLMTAIGDLPGAALQPLMDDVMRHFGLTR